MTVDGLTTRTAANSGKETVELKEHVGRSGIALIGRWLTQHPTRPEYFTHWGEAFKLGAELLGLPIGDYRVSRPPQGILPEEVRSQIRTAFEAAGLIGKALAGRELAPA